jgi:hypothetical protein
MHLERTRMFLLATASAGLLLGAGGCTQAATDNTRPPQTPSTSVAPMSKSAPLAHAWDQIELDVKPMEVADREHARTKLEGGDEGLVEARQLLRGQEPLRKGPLPTSVAPNAIGGGPQPAMDEDVFRQLQQHTPQAPIPPK